MPDEVGENALAQAHDAVLRLVDEDGGDLRFEVAGEELYEAGWVVTLRSDTDTSQRVGQARPVFQQAMGGG